MQVLGAGALILTFVATWMQISDTRKATDRTLRLTANQQQSERFTRAGDQLASKRPEIRIGGIYSLEGVAAESSVRVPPVPMIRAVRPLMISLPKAARANRSSAVCA